MIDCGGAVPTRLLLPQKCQAVHLSVPSLTAPLVEQAGPGGSVLKGSAGLTRSLSKVGDITTSNLTVKDRKGIRKIKLGNFYINMLIAAQHQFI